MGLRLNKTQKKIISDVFKKFNDAGINYVLLRRYEGLPDFIPGDNIKQLDIDLLVWENHFNKAVGITRDIGFEKRRDVQSKGRRSLAEIGLLPVKAIRNPKLASNYLVSNLDGFVHSRKEPSSSPKSPYEIANESQYAYQLESNDVLLDMKNHLSHVSPMDGSRWRLTPIIEQQMLARSEERTGFYAPATPDELTHIVTHCVFEYEGKFTEYYQERCDHLKEQMGSSEWETFEELLSHIYFDADEVVLQCVHESNYSSIRPNLQAYSGY